MSIRIQPLAIVLAAIAVGAACFGVAQAEPANAASYCMMTAYRTTAMAKSTKLVLDCGESGAAGARLVDAVTGKAAKFNSSMDALNYMAAQGYEDRGGYVLNGNTTNPTYVFLLRKQ